jgi:hypothetical protein
LSVCTVSSSNLCPHDISCPFPLFFSSIAGFMVV